MFYGGDARRITHDPRPGKRNTRDNFTQEKKQGAKSFVSAPSSKTQNIGTFWRRRIDDPKHQRGRGKDDRETWLLD